MLFVILGKGQTGDIEGKLENTKKYLALVLQYNGDKNCM